MSPNFALSLSPDGIRLLQRVPGGWHLVGDVTLDVPDLAVSLAELRARALQLDPAGMRTKLLIPNDQIRYMTLDTTRTELDDIHRALDGATPYGIDELVIDFERTGGRTQIAAVARETLQEAEAFATEHDFAPVCFAAVPEPFTFNKEVFFGPTKAAASLLPAGTSVNADDQPTLVTGTVPAPKPAPVADTPEPDAKPAPAAPVAALPPRPATTPDPATDTATAQEKPTADGPPEVMFTSRVQRDPDAPIPPVTPVAPPAVKVLADKEIAADEVLFTRRSASLAVPTGPETGPAVNVAPSTLPAAPPKPIVTQAPEPLNPPTFGGATLTTTPKPVAAPIAPAAPHRMPAAAAARTPTAKAEAPAKPAAKGIFKSAPVGGKPRYLGLILTAVLLLLLALVALWAGTIAPEVRAYLFGATEPSDVAVAAPAPAIEPVPIAVEPVATPEPIVVASAPLTPEGTVLTPAEADRIYAATGVWLRAPRLPLVPQTETLEGAFIAEGQAAQAPPNTAPTLPTLADLAPDLTLFPPVNPPAAGTVFERNAAGFIIATPEGTVLPSGVMLYAGRPDISPPNRPFTPPAALAEVTPDAAPAPDGVVLISGRPDIVPLLRPDSVLALAATQAPAEIPTDLPDAGVALGGVALAGLRPTVRPGDLAPTPPAEPTFAADPALAGKRPALRPEGLAPAEIVEAPEPPAEPETPDINAVVAAIAQAAPPSSFVNATALAVRASRTPELRPQNFSRVVARAQDLQTRQAATATPAVAPAPSAAAPAATAAPATQVSSAPARATGPVPSSVAQAATVDSAIRLRDINLIGVYGRPNNRRALVRLANGRFVKVEVGSDLDGGRVTAIGDNALNYVKRGQTIALQVPAG